MGDTSGLMASTTTAAEPAASGAIIELYAMHLDTGATKYIAEVNGLPVAEGTERDAMTGVYYLLKAASAPVIYSLIGQVTAGGRGPLEV